MAFFFKTTSSTDYPTIKTEPVDETVPDGDNVSGMFGTSTCQECGFQFHNETYIEDHRRWHEHMRSKTSTARNGNANLAGETVAFGQPEMVLKPFACEYCGWRFILKKDMIHHVRTHTGEKPYACSECDKRFSRVHSLNQHKKVHDQESAACINCDKCSKSFGSMRSYVTHCKNAHKEQMQAKTTTHVETAEKAEVSHQTKESSPHNGAVTMTAQSSVSSPSVSGQAGSFKNSDTGNTSNTKHLKETAVDRNHKQFANFSETPLGGGKRGIRFTCQFCGWGFWDKKDKNQHEWTHTGHKPYYCKECCKSFSRSHTLKLHMRSHAGDRPYSCPHCSKSFTSANSLRLHNKVHAMVHKHRCTMCPKSFKRIADFRDHQREHLNSDPVMFARCYFPLGASDEVGTAKTALYPISLSFADSELAIPPKEEPGYRAHDISPKPAAQHDENSSSTSASELPSGPGIKSFQSQDNLQPELSVMDLPSTSEELQEKDRQILIDKYNKLISGPRRWREARFSCQYCDKAFHDKKDCREHQNTHTGFKPYECKVCGKRLSRQHSLKMHMMSHTGSKPYPCSYCNATFRDRSGQRSHELTHARNKKFKCKICQEIFQQESALARHLQAHQKRNPELFTECYPFGYDPRARGEVHLDWAEVETGHVTQNIVVSHEGDAQRKVTHEDVNVPRNIYRRPFRFNCTYCTQRFRDKRDWRQHEYTHTGFKPYSCKLCGKKLSRLHSLKKHMLTHSGENTVACEYCTQTFQNRSSLLSHQRHYHSLVLSHTCCICQMIHKELDDLECHIRGAHGKVVSEIVSKFLGDKMVDRTLAISNHSVPSEQPEYQRDNLISDKADPEDVIVKYLSKQEQQLNQSTATDIDKWLALHRLKFKCSFCDKRFRNKKDWQQHENTHTGYKPYTCNICGKKLSRIQSLKAHRLTHTNELPYVYQGFGESIRTNISLAGHEASKECKSSNAWLKTAAATHTTADEKEGLNENIDLEYLQVPSGPFFFKQQEPRPRPTDAGESMCLSNSSTWSDPRMRGLTKRYRCTYCGWQFSGSSIFRRHQCRHRRMIRKTGKNRLSCSNCKEIFHKKEQLEFHQRSCGFPCSLCAQRFKTMDKLKAHLEKSHADMEPKQQPCSEKEPGKLQPVWLSSSSTVDEDLPSNESTATDLSVVTAETHADNFQPHEVGVRDSKLVTTKLKSVENPKSTSSVSTKRRQTGAKHAVVTCRVCHKSFSHGYALKLHLMMHASETQYKCRQCTRCFSSKKALKKHVESHVSHHPTSGSAAMRTTSEIPACVSIPDALSGASGILIQEPSKPGSHSEQSEARRFKSQTPQTKPHKCVYCGWGFWTRKDCVIHERTHTGEKPYMCKTCGKSFARSYSLKLHSLTHDGLKPFRCSYCNKGFASGGYVRIHERIHTKEKPYECKGCTARFSCSSSLIRHEKSCRLEDDTTGKEVQS
ncbi:zinc finger protein 62 homolog [Patiria miniata]|uniref:C2H2-type domain-containing protein n=1 Tax=Patiria miniata TaxID=46514 RepID=A0A913ZX80_PATMI|nr:zinc finger protein 62 homolog [Patiria miniata]XP_038056258.1 zinc finger protein 62 homolog [Patiria miniata]